MSLEDISDSAAVTQALNEFDALGRDAFLDKYGFGASRGWMVDHGSQAYDAKAILGAAHGYQFPLLGPLPATDFHGGTPTAKVLRRMGFVVSEPGTPTRNPVWSRDELLLALDLYLRHRAALPGDTHSDVVELSSFLGRLAAKTQVGNYPKYRNPNGVAMKLQNFRRFDPEQNGKGLSGGGKGEVDVWNRYADDEPGLRAIVALIRATVESTNVDLSQEPEGGMEAEEGAVLTRLHRFRERNRAIVDRKKADAMRKHRALCCEACGFDFSAAYGERGRGFIECHHTVPVSQLKPGAKTRLEDLVLLCANCHRMVHLRPPWLSLEALIKLTPRNFLRTGTR